MRELFLRQNNVMITLSWHFRKYLIIFSRDWLHCQIEITLKDGPPPVKLAQYGWWICSARASSHPYFGSIPWPRSALPIAYLNTAFIVSRLVKKLKNFRRVMKPKTQSDRHRLRTKRKRANEQWERRLPSITPALQLHILNIYQFS